MGKFRGQFNCSVDDKGRIKMPVSFKQQFDPADKGSFMIKKGLDDCLEIYPLAIWTKEEERLDRLDDYNPIHRAFRGTFILGITELTLDGSDRFLIPKSLMGYLNNTREVIMVGDLNLIKIWEPSKLHDFTSVTLPNMHQYSIEVSNYLNELERNKK
ncbi:MAG: hypothetical protein M9931_00735 [Chitinophagales bacterium]|nr:hypothetical protein [Chitinophagales bacterium]MCO5279561.1 hypothetical protein [Chitinophagales bacterium]OJV24218.1 MAG: hypothetical protein BGO32_04215 [Bacteroidetes bacterium 37-13]HRN93544.1 hypothetical protein [Chitinophagales bacterium]HRP40007.1 hypothetical protein [Chitinophagales bacterium]